MNKNKAIETLNQLPQNFDLDILTEKLIFIEKVEKGMDQLKNNKTLTHDQVKQTMHIP